MSLLTSRSEICQSCLKYYHQRQTVFRSLSAIEEKIFNFKNKFRSNFYCKHVACSFENPARKKLPEMREQFDRRPKIIEKITIFQAKTFVLKIFLTCIKQFWQPRLKIFEKNRLVFAPCPKMIDIFVFINNQFFRHFFPMDT